jgi:hypothetical protein
VDRHHREATMATSLVSNEPGAFALDGLHRDLERF